MRNNRLKRDGETVYHCMSRIVGGEFLLDNEAKTILCKQMWQMAQFCGIEILTFCIMSNHFHILIRVPEKPSLSNNALLEKIEKLYHQDDYELLMMKNIFNHGSEERIEALREQLLARMFDISIFMKELKQRFSIWYNKNHNRYGTIWADRFKSIIVENKRHSMEMVAAYIDLNPVRAGLIDDPKKYHFSGYAQAMSGLTRSRIGIMKVVHEGQCGKKALAEYRELLFGKGAVSQKPHQASINGNLTMNVLQKKGDLSKTELLYCKVRYFSDSLIFGSEAFIKQCIRTNTNALSHRKETEPKQMVGGNWGGLMTLRSVKNLQ